ncbi:glycolate oxidase subunit GlcF [Undibacterium flavidum]|uniref:Glycolate oxidase subunit GlcF n=1 Tax=Undibacterium flavidum TaxID=2762297 RepID=A0ABR6YG31_9BURK|nr:glycolate oxidase subunit GlcF [Undibacterium flavidum]MBC3875502.1 glycolate oxidase subunit GlcF [Undibacterium flavidum]
MQTKISEEFSHSAEGQEAEQILRQCVHCGMCNATCPTYQLLGDELDGPRGRIYLIKQVLEGQQPTQKTQTHLDRCLTCRSCETTCPSGVQYARLLEIGRDIVEKKVGRSITQKMLRGVLKNGLSNPRLFQHALTWGRKIKPVLPRQLQEKIPAATSPGVMPQAEHARKVIMLEGCVQPGLAPNINAATSRVLDRLQIQTVRPQQAGCCGAVRLHLSDTDGAIVAAKNNIDAWWPLVNEALDTRVEHIVMTAAGCGVTVKDYGHLLAHDSAYAEKAKKISALTCDLSELLTDSVPELIALVGGEITEKLVWHAPCSLQHGQQVRGKVESILQSLGVAVQTCADSHLCCGSAGTYSILQSDLARQLRDNKIRALEASGADVIVSANMACQQHLQTGTKMPVLHWIEVLDQALANRSALIGPVDAVSDGTDIATVAEPVVTSPVLMPSESEIAAMLQANGETTVAKKKSGKATGRKKAAGPTKTGKSKKQ